MKIGDVVPVKNLRMVHATGWADFKAPKGEQFLVVLLGSEPIDGSAPIDPFVVFEALGWKRGKPRGSRRG